MASSAAGKPGEATGPRPDEATNEGPGLDEAAAASAGRGASGPKGGLAHRLYTGDLAYDFVRHRKLWYVVSAVVLTICLLALLLRGLNLSIEFRGGTEFAVPTQVTAATADEYREVVQGIDLPDNENVRANTVGADEVRVQTRALNAQEETLVRNTLADHARVPPDQVTNSLIGASWGQQITERGLLALVVFLALVSLMIWAYFRHWKMAVAAIVALIHDLWVTIGVYALLQFTFSPASLIGMLTILGYSLYDTVVVFDKVRENTVDITHQRRSYSRAVNSAINQVLVRSINTTIIGVLPVAALLFAGVFILGTGPLKDLGLALFVGMIAGAYSSIFIAAPLLAQMKEAEPEQREHAARLARRESGHGGVPAPGGRRAVVATAGSTAAPVDPARVGAVRADEFRERGTPAQPPERHQPTRSSRSERRKP